MRVPGIPYVQGRNAYKDSDGLKFGIAIHNTSNDASDEGEASYATRRTDGVSAHLYCDKDSVTQSIDTEDRVGHAGSSIGNNNSLAVEITGSNAKSRDWWLKNVAWDKLGKVLAYIIKHDPDYRGFQVRRASVSEMKANPRVKAFYGHDDMRRAWGGTTHTDPGPNFPWDRLISVVKEYLEEDKVTKEEMQAAVVVGVHSALDQAAMRNTPTGRQMGDDISVLIAAHTAPISAKLDVLAEGMQVALAGNSFVPEMLAKLEEIDREATEQATNTQALLVELRTLVGKQSSGEMDAEAVVRRIGELLSDKTE